MKNEFISTDPAKQARILKDEENAHLRDVADMQELLKIPRFRRLLWRIWTITGIYRTPFSTNALNMAQACGVQAVGQGLLADVNAADPNAFAQIQREYISEQKSKEAAEKNKEEGKDG
jgi:hypothetical protein